MYRERERERKRERERERFSILSGNKASCLHFSNSDHELYKSLLASFNVSNRGADIEFFFFLLKQVLFPTEKKKKGMKKMQNERKTVDLHTYFLFFFCFSFHWQS